MKVDLRRVTFGTGGRDFALAAAGREALGRWVDDGFCVFCMARHDGVELLTDHSNTCPLRALTRRPEPEVELTPEVARMMTCRCGAPPGDHTAHDHTERAK